MQVKWLRKAALNLEDAHDYLANDNPRVAQEFVLEVYRLVRLLKSQPAMGRPGRVPGTRELVVQPYPFLIPYRVKDEEIHILRVFHTRLRPPSNWG
ncbi:type II toxin-antitoxin system RelE/ParE family toxin [Aeromonas hydrophila]|uniref:type II toxin-antitoxin system RelE/ParE family toxin n=2 Tax=Aeromonas hydrophila TaxID=644 RepID=UPI001C5B1E45|nr:type II toxin-antitoxin system RelE/ParE family toxin [Aeromonas hydrophila]MBW3817248.1 type II toxin-antitoxin system RelE/ParE family toxin [Aeromonas hydrophila]MCF7677992.1 type II toxin-antitoxin system RelE/ParE family toxin [Aeromonas hydrophila]MCF7680543.1 type II toxin-antitoxin system RelE/ParE family toxin [Aeromonas hydrophila]MCF7772207.1 type II toxin-antitoxin system RelE/ParE family toxin [Aeromonas hydrophila]MCF7774323.1 type II toxin-antitoxin system RelE/ParE family to